MNQNTILEVNKTIFLENAKKIEEYIYPRKIIPIVKANSYGTYLNEDIQLMNHFDILGVARTEEGIKLREIGYQKEILILNPITKEELERIYKYQLTMGLSIKEMIKEIKNPIKVHLEIETGMNRSGINPKEIEEVIKEIKNNKNIKVEGVYTHLSSADKDIRYTKKQINLFEEVVEELKHQFELKYIHSSASNGLLNFKDNCSNYTRPGILLYGYESFEGARKMIPINPVATLKTKIVFLKEIEENTPISYNQTYKTDKKTLVATIPIGYADGLKRSLSNKGEVLVHNKRCKIIGNICMDSCMIDVTGVDVKLGDTVYIWDNKEITLEEISEKANTINYELLSTISKRVTRKFK
ncbi:MAG: alanine racemase [Bacilli bacterium]|nr:alanine racemase [Bacilli bacterium]